LVNLFADAFPVLRPRSGGLFPPARARRPCPRGCGSLASPRARLGRFLAGATRARRKPYRLTPQTGAPIRVAILGIPSRLACFRAALSSLAGWLGAPGALRRSLSRAGEWTTAVRHRPRRGAAGGRCSTRTGGCSSRTFRAHGSSYGPADLPKSWACHSGRSCVPSRTSRGVTVKDMLAPSCGCTARIR